MGDLFFTLTLTIISLTLPEAQATMSARLLDNYIRDYTFSSMDKPLRTGELSITQLPANFSGIKAASVRLRCGSLRRYGSRVNEFILSSGVAVQHCRKRVVLVAQNLGQSWSSVYSSGYNLTNYRLVSPVLGLLAYNGETHGKFRDPIELGIVTEKKPISINFTNANGFERLSQIRPLCASFEGNGTVRLTEEVEPSVCSATTGGHFGLVMESAQKKKEKKEKEIGGWKLGFGTSIGGVLGAFLLVLLLIAMFVRVKKRMTAEELQRRAYEDEALQVSMAGLVRAPL